MSTWPKKSYNLYNNIKKESYLSSLLDVYTQTELSSVHFCRFNVMCDSGLT